jgi:N-acetylneuraminate synthase
VFQTAGNPLCVMQCNTNYTGSLENLHYVNLNVLNQYRERYPDAILGLSDHTPGHITVLGGVALGARAIEKHFTDDTTRTGPDHGFSLDPTAWRDMVDATRILEAALGNGIKDIEENERQTSVLQRRCVRAARDLPAGTVLQREDLAILRPAPQESVQAHEIATLIGAPLNGSVVAGQRISRSDVDT